MGEASGGIRSLSALYRRQDAAERVGRESPRNAWLEAACILELAAVVTWWPFSILRWLSPMRPSEFERDVEAVESSALCLAALIIIVLVVLALAERSSFPALLGALLGLILGGPFYLSTLFSLAALLLILTRVGHVTNPGPPAPSPGTRPREP